MLSYQHAYHAGNFADVHKHLTLFAVVDHLLCKDSPVTYLDTHAGRGLYSLSSEASGKSQEYRQGVMPLWRTRDTLTDPLLHAWLVALDEAQRGVPSAKGDMLEHYPGSPWWLANRLRPRDRLTLFELHPGEHGHLAGLPLPDNVRRIQADGLQGLRQGLPVATPRLCVLIDPSYERKTDYAEVAEAVLSTLRKVRHGVVLVWYPLLPAGRHRGLLESLRDEGLRKIWRSELILHDPGSGEHGMFGSGMLVVNPPWGLEQRLSAAMESIVPLLGSTSRYRGGWWVEE